MDRESWIERNVGDRTGRDVLRKVDNKEPVVCDMNWTSWRSFKLPGATIILGGLIELRGAKTTQSEFEFPTRVRA